MSLWSILASRLLVEQRPGRPPVAFPGCHPTIGSRSAGDRGSTAVACGRTCGTAKPPGNWTCGRRSGTVASVQPYRRRSGGSADALGPALDARSRLCQSVRTLPVPGSPPRLAGPDGGAIGLSFLETGLRQNHVRRITETLSLEEHAVVKRSVSLDLSVGLLDEAQVRAGSDFDRLRGTHVGQVGADRHQHQPLLWIPIARLSRRATSPVDVRDAKNAVVPRLTQYETAHLLASGLYHLMHAILEVNSSNSGDQIAKLLEGAHEARWLVRGALLSLFQEKSAPGVIREPRAPTDDERTGSIHRRRELVLDVLETTQALAPFFDLLDVALRDYLVIVGLHHDKAEHTLTYEAPLEATAAEVVQPIRALVPRLRRSPRYAVKYETSFSAQLPAYHIVAEVQSGANIAGMVLSCDVDAPLVERLAIDLLELAEQLSSLRALELHQKKPLELELEDVLRRIAQLYRRRMWDAEQVGGELRERHVPNLACIYSEVWAAYLHKDGTDDTTFKSSLMLNPALSPEVLAGAASELQLAEFALDISEENDPLSTRAHAYWRRENSSSSERAHTVHARCAFVVVDASSVTTRSVTTFALSILLLLFLVGAASFGTLSPTSWRGDDREVINADALAALLLVVPGYLYSRLELPPRASILARVRLSARLLSYALVATSCAVAAVVAALATTEHLPRVLWVGLIVQGLLFLFSLVLWLAEGERVGQRVNVAAAPRWFWRDGSQSLRRWDGNDYSAHFAAPSERSDG